MSLKYAENKIGKPYKSNARVKSVWPSFLWKRKTFWVGLIKPYEKFGSGLQYSFHLNTKVTLYCDAKMNVISDVLRDREDMLSKTSTTS